MCIFCKAETADELLALVVDGPPTFMQHRESILNCPANYDEVQGMRKDVRDYFKKEIDFSDMSMQMLLIVKIAKRRRELLELLSTPSFTCPDCGRTSYNPNDIKNQFCGACHTFPEDRARRRPT